MYEYAQSHPDSKLLYLHTKGVSHDPSSHYIGNINDWIEVTPHGLIDKHEFCIEMLNDVDTVGMHYMSERTSNSPDHFSGNFWWVTAKYCCPVPITTLNGKADAEFILFKSKPTFVNIWGLQGPLVSLYWRTCKIDSYQELIEQGIIGFRELVTNISNQSVFYGVEGSYVNVTAHCKTGNMISVTAGDHLRNVAFGDHRPGVVKHILIGKVKFGYQESVRFNC